MPAGSVQQGDFAAGARGLPRHTVAAVAGAITSVLRMCDRRQVLQAVMAVVSHGVPALLQIWLLSEMRYFAH